MMVGLYGYSWVIFLACLLNYELSLLQMLLICGASLLVERLCLHTVRSALITALSSAGLILMLAWLLHAGKRLETAVAAAASFFEPYFMSLNPAYPVAIDGVRQAFLLFLAGTAIYRLLYMLLLRKRMLWVFSIASLVMVSAGFLMGRLSGKSDRPGLVAVGAIWIVLYFYRYYKEHRLSIDEERSFWPYVVLSLCFSGLVFGIAQLLFLSMPRPIELHKADQAAVQAIRTAERNAFRENMKLFQDGVISDEFDPKGWELFQVRTKRVLYMKGAVYEVYQSGSWSQLPEEAVDERYNMQMPETELAERVDVQFTRIESPALFVGGNGTLDLVVEDGVSFHMDRFRGTYYTDDRSTDSDKKMRYHFMTPLNYWTDEGLESRLRLLPDPQALRESRNPYVGEAAERIRSLALEITDGKTTNYDKVEAVRNYLRANYQYSTAPVIENTEEEDSILRFLFETKTGFCQHFASAAALLLGSLDVDVRYVTGFRADPTMTQEEAMYLAQNNLLVEPGFTIVSDSDAHAWIEVYYPGYGWRLSEMTSGFEISEPAQSQSIETTAVQQEAFQKERREALWPLIFSYLPLVLLLMPILLPIQVQRSRRRFRKRETGDRLRVLYGLIQAYLKVMKLDRQPFETPREHATRVDNSRFFYSETTFVDIIPVWEAYLYGGKAVAEDDYDQYLNYYAKVQENVHDFKGAMRCLPVRMVALMTVGRGIKHEKKHHT